MKENNEKVHVEEINDASNGVNETNSVSSTESTVDKSTTETSTEVDSKTTTQEVSNSEDKEKTPENKTENKETNGNNETTDNKTENKENEDELKLTHLNKDFVYELMSVPTVSNAEYRMVTFIILWARRNNIEYEFDKYGNVYLTKGELAEGEFYPCVTAHLDSVQSKQKPYAQVGYDLEVKTRVINKKHEIFVDGMGIGGDDKAGVLIGLSMFNHVDKLKACFFLEEETGCNGSKNLNVEWFKNVGYVIGYDSPDLNRAAWACSGTKLFSADFFKTHIQEICKNHGVTIFKSEPFTDVKEIREKTNIVCMNFGSGYYNAHMSNEYCVIEDMDNACRMGHALINKLGNKEYKLEHKSKWKSNNYGGYVRVEDEDESFFDTLGGYNYRSSYYSNNYNSSNRSTTSTTTTTTSTTSTTNKNDNKVDFDTLKYIAERYDEHIEDMKNQIKTICDKNNIDIELFKSIFETSEIKF